METIRNYLESMFKNLPQTEKVIKAKYELGQMMEDKYAELIKEGKSENEAVGTVISEFGNLEELASDLGIEDIYKTNQTINRRKVSYDDAKAFLAARKQQSILRSSGIATCILSVIGPIFTDALNINDVTGVVLFLCIVAVGVCLLVFSKLKTNDFTYLYREPCSIDKMTADYVKGLKRDYSTTYSILISIGVLLCIFSIIPPILLDNTFSSVIENLSSAFLFMFVAAGVFLITFTAGINGSYIKLLKLNDETDFSEDYSDDKKYNNSFKNKNFKLIMEIYWPVVTCIYLCVSFISFSWHITWIIWPIAAIFSTILRAVLKNMDEGDK